MRKIVRSQPAKKYVRNILILPQLAPVAASMLRIRAPDQKDAPVHRYEGFYLANHEKAKSHRYQQPLRSNPDLLQERNLSRMAFLLIPIKEELISVLKFIESLGTHVTLIFIPLRSTLVGVLVQIEVRTFSFE